MSSSSSSSSSSPTSDMEMVTANTLGAAAGGGDGRHTGLSRSQAWNLYLSHALSTWNARGYEFAAVLFTAAAYPGTLIAASARMIIIYFAMILFSSSIGSWVDRSPSRLRTLVTTIVCNRGSVIVGSLFWLAILSQRDLLATPSLSEGGNHDSHDDISDLWLVLPTNPTLKAIGFALAVCCGIAERLSASGNLMSMERDWVPTVALPSSSSSSSSSTCPYDLTHLNAVMRRIDLVCKLFSPIVLSLVISLSGSTRIGVVFTGVTSAVCIPVEIVSATRVWRGSRALQEPKQRITNTSAGTASPAAADQEGEVEATGHDTTPTTSRRRIIVMDRLRAYQRDFAMYFSSAVWIPSFALAMLHFNMLTWRATFITYLITVGYPLNVITAARTAGSLFEITSTIITPRAVVYLGRTKTIGDVARHRRRRGVGDDDDASQGLLSSSPEIDKNMRERETGHMDYDGVEDGIREEEEEEEWEQADRQTLTGLQRAGLWGISWQIANTIPVVLAIWAITNDLSPSPSTSSSTATPTVLNIPNTVILFTFLSMSRLGVWVFDLTTQQLTQTLVPAAQRSSFAGVENSVTNVFELAGAMASIIFPQPGQYPWLATASLAACVFSWALYAGWVRRRRGHLVHLDRVGRWCFWAGGEKGKERGRSASYEVR